MKKSASLFIISLLISAFSFALEVDEPELKSITNEPIEFISYNGPHKVIDSLAAIKGIGSGLGKLIVPSQPSQIGDKNKYYVIHAVDEKETGKLDADILFIGKNATVDHIKNLRRIISAYLSAAYGYSEKDADTLAVFITVYNAVYRGNLSTFEAKYKKAVTKNLSAENCGLALNYKDWPGKSEIIIPLYNVNGGLSTVDTTVISDSTVVDSMKEDDDKNVDTRKDLVDIKEREAEDANKKAQETGKKAEDKQKEANNKKKEADNAKKDAEQAKKDAEQNPSDKDAQKKAEDTQKVAEQKQAEADQVQKEADETKKEAEKQQQVAEQKQNEAENERKEIAKDQQDVQKAQQEQAKMAAAYGIILSDEAQMLSRLVKFNTANGDIIKRSPVTEIRNRTIYKAGNEYMAIAGHNGENAVIKLVLISEDTMEITTESNETVAENSVLVQDGSDYYCVVDDNGRWVVAKFNAKLELQKKSPVSVTSSTPITITDAGIVVTSTGRQLILLSKSDLTAITAQNNLGNEK
ncbi:MAG: hypothetical protein K6A43_08850 [Treponema sp.]|nr:hypothetical protein [Treponema sp.]